MKGLIKSISSIVDVSGQVGRVIEELHLASDKINETAMDNQNRALTVAAASDEMVSTTSDIAKNCEIITFEELLTKNHYDTVIYEGGQGLLLDQANRDNFPHLTPSSVGMYNIYSDIAKLNCTPDIFYVSRTYMTRHGAGPMEAECDKTDINPDIVDKVNQPNEWQGSLRFGLLDTDTLYQRIQKDMKNYNGQANVNLVFTQLNYTNEKLATVNGLVDIEKPDFCAHLYVSNDKRKMEKKE